MHNYKDVITKIQSVIDSYHVNDNVSGDELVDYMRVVSSALFYLESVRADYHKKYNVHMNELIKSGQSAAAAKISAEVNYPELYELRYETKACYEVLGVMRSQLSYIKLEMNGL